MKKIVALYEKNKKRRYLCRLFILFVLLIPVSAKCDDSSTQGYSEKVVTFVVPIPIEMFSQNAILRARLWNEEQLEISEKNSACTVTYSVQTKTQDIRCPEGIEYQEASPEEFTFLAREVTSSIKLKSTTIRLGEKYRLQISGLSNDNCNTTSADVRDVATSGTITTGKLSWNTTERACR